MHKLNIQLRISGSRGDFKPVKEVGNSDYRLVTEFRSEFVQFGASLVHLNTSPNMPKTS